MQQNSENTSSKSKSFIHLTQNDHIVINNEYILHRCFYRGIIHNLYLGSIKNNIPDQFFIVKLQNNEQTYYQNEEKTLRKLKETLSVPHLITCGEQKLKTFSYHYQVLPRYGPSLKLCFQILEFQFSLPVIALLAIQTLTSLEKIHANCIVHRNLKPKKILTFQENQIIINDFRFSQKYKKKSGGFNQKSEANKLQNKQFLNKFSSLNMHLGICNQLIIIIIQASSPKDDLESLSYILFYFLKKGQFLKTGETQQITKLKKLENYKLNFIPEKQLPNLPIEFIQFYNAVKMSNIIDYPMNDYEIYKKLFRSLLNRIGVIEKNVHYPWVISVQSIQRNNLKNLATQKSLNQTSQKQIGSGNIDEEENESDKNSENSLSDSEMKKEDGSDEPQIQQKMKLTQIQEKVAFTIFDQKKFTALKVLNQFKQSKLSIKIQKKQGK